MKIFMVAWIVNMIFACIPNSWMRVKTGPLVKGDAVKGVLGILYLAINALALFKLVWMFFEWVLA